MVEQRKEGKYVEYRCVQCGKWYVAKERNYKETCSVECSMARVTEAVNQMHTKSGPLYDKWLKHLTASLRGEEYYEPGEDNPQG
jgi:hypothetical protein